MILSSRLAGLSAFFVAVALFYAPIAYGCARPEMLPGLFILVGAAIAFGIAGMATSGEWPRTPKTALLCVGMILIQGWWMTISPDFESIISSNGGIVDTTPEAIHAASLHSMEVTTLLLIAFLVLCELLGHANPRRFILLAVALSGAVIAVCGIALKLGGEPLMSHVWKKADIDWNDFAFFRYHANAGAFLNLAWPLILTFTRRAYTPTVGLGKRLIWTVAALACGSAFFLNASKSSLAIGLLILPWPFVTGLARMRGRTLFAVGAVAAFLIAGGMFASSRLAREAAFQRMTEVSAVQVSFDGRWAAYGQFLAAVPETGAFGLGPGLFPLAFPYQTSPLGNVSPALRDYAHEDYLQCLLEWGWVGTIWWTMLVVGGLYRAFRTYLQRVRFPSKTDRHLLLAVMVSVMGTLAQALIDFPLQIASIRLVFLVLLALCWASPHLLTAPPRSGRRHYRLPVPAQYAQEAQATKYSL